jgi:hypothetical protein
MSNTKRDDKQPSVVLTVNNNCNITNELKELFSL